MQMDSLTFLFILFPLGFLLYLLLPDRFKNAGLLALSLVCYAMAQPTYLLLLILCVYFDFCMARAISDCDYNKGIARIPLVLSLVKGVALLLYFSFKQELTGAEIPLGFGIYVLTSAWYLIDLYRENVPPERSFIDFALYCLFFPKLYAGPVTEYMLSRKQLKTPEHSLSRVGDGIILFIQGLAKKVILADGLAVLYEEAKAAMQDNLTTLLAWMLVISFGLGFYFRLSSLCDMARGLSRIFGMDLPINFYYPFQSRSVEDFFHRFNITVNKFIRKNVYLSLGEDRNGVASTVFNTLLLGLLMGLWYGINLNFMIWGLYFSLFMLLEKYVYGRWLARLPGFFSRLYTLCVVMLSFALLAGGSWNSIGSVIAAMFTNVCGTYDNTALYLLSYHYGILLVSAVAATSLAAGIGRALRNKRPVLSGVLRTLLYTALLVVTVAFML